MYCLTHNTNYYDGDSCMGCDKEALLGKPQPHSEESGKKERFHGKGCECNMPECLRERALDAKDAEIKRLNTELAEAISERDANKQQSNRWAEACVEAQSRLKEMENRAEDNKKAAEGIIGAGWVSWDSHWSQVSELQNLVRETEKRHAEEMENLRKCLRESEQKHNSRTLVELSATLRAIQQELAQTKALLEYEKDWRDKAIAKTKAALAEKERVIAQSAHISLELEQAKKEAEAYRECLRWVWREGIAAGDLKQRISELLAPSHKDTWPHNNPEAMEKINKGIEDAKEGRTEKVIARTAHISLAALKSEPGPIVPVSRECAARETAADFAADVKSHLDKYFKDGFTRQEAEDVYNLLGETFLKYVGNK